MAPSRRKGGKKAAAAAACREWKVGDLVLAKVKGFPAWPATVSELAKWGYSTDRKKVLVYFFGTQQIAFCNPADIVAFTEEKKQSLVKCRGRGADFVRAVKEIIESYEKLKRKTQVDNISSGGEVTNLNVSNPLDPSTSIGLKDELDAALIINSQMKYSNSATDRPELVCAAEHDSAVAMRDESNDKEDVEEPPDNSVATATVKSPLPVTLRNTPAQRSRSPSQVQNFVVPCSDGGSNGGNTSSYAIQKASIRRNKHIRKSPDLFGCSGNNSDVSMEENGSEIITTNSDAYSLHEGSVIDSNLELEVAETVECPDCEVELNKGHHETKSAINKKKRKPNKRETNDAGAQNACQNLQNMCGNSKERCSDQDGDKHLPLSKRARVRMGKSSPTETEQNHIVQVQGKSCKEDINSTQQIITSSNCEKDSLPIEDPAAFNGALVDVPSTSLAPCSEYRSQICEVKREQMFGCSMDDEAALPPSKRLHRALEAMSANATEEGYVCMEPSSSIMTSSGGFCISATKRCPCTTINNKGSSDLELQGLNSWGVDCSNISVCCFSAHSNPMILTEKKLSAEVDKLLTKIQQHETGKDVIPGARDQVGEELSDSMVFQPAKIDSQVPIQGKVSPNFDVKFCKVGSNQDSPGPSLPPNNDDNIRPGNHSDASDTLDHGGISLDPVAGANESCKLLPQNSINAHHNVIAVCEDEKRAAGAWSKINDMQDAVKVVNFNEQEKDRNSVSISNDCSDGKGNLGSLSSPSLTSGGDCHLQGSPPNTSVCYISTSDSSNILQNGSCSPDVHQNNIFCCPIDDWKDGTVANQQSRSVGKSTEAGHAALLYFGAMLGTLTRTKESIGRATRIAIDCAKFGIATKVVEILVHNLETESSLHRRVDLFFLVDSIVQCSRKLKGDVGGVYPSALQAVLPRLLSAAAPPGNIAQENRRQCLKVLKLWLKRRILPEPTIRRHIQKLDSYNSLAFAGAFSRRSLRTERAFDDPVREMEGMLVDEYGSNSSFQLPGFYMPRMLEEEGSDSDGGNFEAVTPEHDSETHEVQEKVHAIEKHKHVLEDVDGELEMEDVAPSSDVEFTTICNVDQGNSMQLEKNLPLSCVPSLLQDVSSFPPPPSSSLPPPPPPPPPPTVHPMLATSNQYHTTVDSKVFADSQTVKDNTLHSTQPLAAPRNIEICRDMLMQIPKSTCSFNTYPVQPPDNSRSSDGVMHNKGYSLQPPHHVPSNQFSFVHVEHHVKSQREVPPPPSYSNAGHFTKNMKRENNCNNHERLKPPPCDYQESWNFPAPYSGALAPYGCHPSESTRLSGHGWRFPPPSVNYRDSMPFRPRFEDAIPVTNRGPSFWQPR
ncbi:protein HUA2-LIKE 3-like isoform X2 [Lotus japonicus]|uniref:protein HUA2-LIKE 3-like isoform X2 n=1 Tax=Lotus japonicus TaxID=34305 RepID=UPI002585F588|nr:protein HUA2-LIKE 3-like isoform X2 [Lotus japonicus]